MQIQPCGPLHGEITVPGDKSISHRAVMLGALANGTTHITGFLMGEDCLSTIDCFRKMGVSIDVSDKEVVVEGVGLHGLTAPECELYTGNSGMEKSGYILRKVDEKDQRMMRLDLTEKGQACIEHVKAIAEKMDEIAFTGISPEEKMLLRRILFQICENIEKERNR